MFARIRRFISNQLLFAVSPGMYKHFWKRKFMVSKTNVIAASKKYEKEIFLLTKVLKPETVFFDIGANLGMYLFWAEELGVKKAVGFEPLYHLHKRLKRIFPDYKVESLALSDISEKRSFRIPVLNGKKYDTRATLSDLPDPVENANYKVVSVSSGTLTDYCRKNNIFPDIIKIDVEGHEAEVIRGGLEIIKERKPVLLVEIEGRHHEGFGIDQVISLLTNENFTCLHFNKDTFEVVEYCSESELQDEVDFGKKNYINNFIFVSQRDSKLLRELLSTKMI